MAAKRLSPVLGLIALFLFFRKCFSSILFLFIPLYFYLHKSTLADQREGAHGAGAPPGRSGSHLTARPAPVAVRREDDTEIQLEMARIRSLVESASHGAAHGAANGLVDKEAGLAGAPLAGALGAAPATGGIKPALRKVVDHVACRTPTGKAFFIVMGLMTFMQLSGIDAVIFYLVEIFRGKVSQLGPTPRPQAATRSRLRAFP